MEEGLDDGLLRSRTIDEILARSAQDDLSSYADLLERFIVHGRFLFVGVVEDDGDGCFRDTGLSSFVD